MPPKSAMLDIIATDEKFFALLQLSPTENLTTFDSISYFLMEGKIFSPNFRKVYVLDYSQNLMLSEGSLRKVWLNFRKFRIEVRMDDNQRLTDR